MDYGGVKAIAIALLFLLTLLAGLLPIRINRANSAPRQRLLSICNCFAGGVFFATCLLDLLPMIREKYNEAFTLAKISSGFPVAEFTTCIGFFIVLITEQFVHTFHKKVFLHGLHSNEHSKTPLLSSANHSVRSGQSSQNAGISATSNSLKESVRRQNEDSSMRTYILVLALSMHSIFEGLALGLIVDMDRLTQIAVAIVIHKSVIAFSLTVNLLQHDMPIRTVVKAAVLFSIMAPIGLGIGIAVLTSASIYSASLSSAILQGIANGTFLFVTFFEIFQRELTEKGNRLLKVMAMILGYSVVTGLVYFANVLEHSTHNVKRNSNKPNSTSYL